MRYAFIFINDTDPAKIVSTIKSYMPYHYNAEATPGGILISGEDNAGWTLHDYVIPRLASGMWTAHEISEATAKSVREGGIPSDPFQIKKH